MEKPALHFPGHHHLHSAHLRHQCLGAATPLLAGEFFQILIEEGYNKYLETYSQPLRDVNQHPDNYPGKSLYSKYLHNPEYRKILQRIHYQSYYYTYLADKIRTTNSINMKLMDITEDDLAQFLKESSVDSFPPDSIKHVEDFATPELNPDSLPDIHTFLSD